MTQENVFRRALAHFDRLPADEGRLLEALAVHQWFGTDIALYTAANLDVGVPAEHVLASPFVVRDRVPYGGPGGDPQYAIRSALRTALHDRMRTERTAVYQEAHRIAFTYYNQPLQPLRTDRLIWYVYEIRHLLVFRPELVAERLAAFAHEALIAGHAEAAGRAAAEVADAPVAPGARSLAGIIQAVAVILNAPAHVERSTIVALDDLLARHGTPSDPTATRLVSLARDLVVHYTERPAPVTPLTALVVPDATTTVDPRGMPVLGGELRLLQDLAHPDRTITTRTHRVKLVSRSMALHQVTTKLATEDRPGRRSMVLADLLPQDHWDRLEVLHLSERGVSPVTVLPANETVRVMARGVGRLLAGGEQPPENSTRAELSRRLDSLGWRSGTEELTALLRRTGQADDVEEALRQRVEGLMRYTPLVALLDVHPGLPSEVTYQYEEDCVTHRDGWGRVVISLDLALPRALTNRLEFVTPEGLVPADVQGREGTELVRVRNERTASTTQQFAIETARPTDDDGEDEGMARILVDLGYRLPDREFKDALRTAYLCMLLSALALLLLFLDITLVSIVGTVLASIGVLVDVSRDGSHHEGNEPLHVYTGKPMFFLRRSNAVAAIAASAAPNANSLLGSLAASGVAFLYCLATCLIVVSVKRAALRPLPEPSGHAFRALRHT
ncbi:hypothetical protein ACIF8T_34325 [Streptomyces sp. NPDC085946]|uniref:hypothetical protein n=1 Tax=Streptomyces sp. NPDC085946 TaxID=3365744 RepID=UPI0037D480D9